MAHEPRLIEVPERHFLVVRATLRAEQIADFVPQAYADISRQASTLGVEPASGPMAHYLDFHGPIFEMEAAFRFAGPVTGQGSVVATTEPPGRAVTVEHQGPYQTLDRAYGAVEAWISEHSLEATGESWEEYLRMPGEAPDGEPLTRLDLTVR